MGNQNYQKREANSGPIKGFLIDINGVLYVEERVVRGAVEAIAYLQKHAIPFLLVTNNTRRSRFALHNNLQHLGFQIELEQIFSAPYAASLWLKANNIDSINLLLQGDAYREFKDFTITANHPEYLIIGDIGDDLTYTLLNQAFRLVKEGTEMLALHKNRYWLKKDELFIDAGATVAAMEYATQKSATVIGKPSISFFNEAIRLLDLPAENIAIIGDDLDTDIKGGLQAGLYSVAVKTGKFSQEQPLPHIPRAHRVLDSVADLPNWLETQMFRDDLTSDKETLL